MKITCVLIVIFIFIAAAVAATARWWRRRHSSIYFFILFAFLWVCVFPCSVSSWHFLFGLLFGVSHDISMNCRRRRIREPQVQMMTLRAFLHLYFYFWTFSTSLHPLLIFEYLQFRFSSLFSFSDSVYLFIVRFRISANAPNGLRVIRAEMSMCFALNCPCRFSFSSLFAKILVVVANFHIVHKHLCVLLTSRAYGSCHFAMFVRTHTVCAQSTYTAINPFYCCIVFQRQIQRKIESPPSPTTITQHQHWQHLILCTY